MRQPTITERLNLALFGGVRKRLAKRYRVNYRKYIVSRRWRRKARKIRVRDNWTCQDCGEHGSQVHHETYARLGFELSIDLVTLCDECHRKRHGK